MTETERGEGESREKERGRGRERGSERERERKGERDREREGGKEGERDRGREKQRDGEIQVQVQDGRTLFAYLGGSLTPCRLRAAAGGHECGFTQSHP